MVIYGNQHRNLEKWQLDLAIVLGHHRKGSKRPLGVAIYTLGLEERPHRSLIWSVALKAKWIIGYFIHTRDTSSTLLAWIEGSRISMLFPTSQ